MPSFLFAYVAATCSRHSYCLLTHAERTLIFMLTTTYLLRRRIPWRPPPRFILLCAVWHGCARQDIAVFNAQQQRQQFLLSRAPNRLLLFHATCYKREPARANEPQHRILASSNVSFCLPTSPTRISASPLRDLSNISLNLCPCRQYRARRCQNIAAGVNRRLTLCRSFFSTALLASVWTGGCAVADCDAPRNIDVNDSRPTHISRRHGNAAWRWRT